MGIFLAILGILVSIVVYWLTRRIRRLTCSFTTPAVVDLRPEVIKGTAREQISADFAGRPLQQLSVIQATVRNAGTEPAELRAIEEPIRFTFRPEVNILASEVIGRSFGVNAEPSASTPALEWTFRSLDRNEYFTIQFLVEGALQVPPEVTARILGFPSGIEVVSKGVESAETSTKQGPVLNRWTSLLGIVLGSAGILVGLSYTYMARFSDVVARVDWLTQQEQRQSILLRKLADLHGEEMVGVAGVSDIVKVTLGKEIFETKCAICHSFDTSDKKIGPGLKGVRDGKLPSGKAATYENLLDNLNKGGGGMPAFEKLLTSEEKDNVISYVLTL